jgi:hypothetical protein
MIVRFAAVVSTAAPPLTFAICIVPVRSILWLRRRVVSPWLGPRLLLAATVAAGTRDDRK